MCNKSEGQSVHRVGICGSKQITVALMQNSSGNYIARRWLSASAAADGRDITGKHADMIH